MTTHIADHIHGGLRSWRLLRLLSMLSIALTGCFSPRFMKYDIDAYNRQYLEAEQRMILYNIGLLRHDQPPHFMMLTSVNQTRTFSANAAFQWTHLWNSLFIPSNGLNNGNVTTNGSNSYSIGPFAAGVVENPTYVFTPIQGQDFANRFETPLTDKFTLFLEDERWHSTAETQAEIVELFVQSLWLQHGRGAQDGVCKAGLYRNGRPSEFPGLTSAAFYLNFDKCVDYILRAELNYTMIDGIAHQVPTAVSGKPLPADLVTALAAGYEWTKNDGNFVLSNPVRLPAWLDYDPAVTPPSPKGAALVNPDPAFWLGKKGRLATKDIPDLSKVGSNYSWKRTNVGEYILIPDGYTWDATTGRLVRDSPSIPQDQPTYANEIVRAVWPVQQDYFYVELRQEKAPVLTDQQVARVCVEHSPTIASSHTENEFVWEHPTGSTTVADPSVSNVVCGYFSIGRLLEVLQSLAKKACDVPGAPSSKDQATDCSQSIFGVGPKAPPWAIVSSDYTYPGSDGKLITESIWTPVHHPGTPLGQRDERMFLLVYKLYQMSLVDTSKLVTGNVPITIAK